MTTPPIPMRRRAPTRPRPGAIVAALVAVALVLAVPVAVAAQVDEDPALDQTIDADAPVVDDVVTLDVGHVDVGPRFVDGDWTFLVHDDTDIPSVWRSFDRTVLAVTDDALLPVPDDPTYDFLGVGAGEQVHVIPQTEASGVVWLGWNTQDPGIMETIDRGATLTLLGVQGPGDLIMYLQSGDLGEPQVLWRSTSADPQPLWVEVNTHAHANWVFTEPGTYLVQVEVSADLVDGEAVRDVQTLRFAVGDDADPADALSAEFTAALADGDGEEASTDTTTGDDDESMAPVVIGGIVLGVGALGAALVLVLTRGASARRRAEAERTAAAADPTASDPRP